jgi:4-alpha-glucanotransferase
MGDLPFLVGGDSADIWARAQAFHLDLRAGVPPDAFSDDGQDWGLPVFRWDAIAAGDYHWMRERARHNAELYDMFRVDHVVGLYRTFYRPDAGPRNGPGRFTPSDEPSQIRLGETVLGILDGGARRVIAEDLGTVPDFVRASLGRLGVPGYRVLRWEQDDGVFRDPAAYPALSVATTGTHDTESVADWYEALGAAEREAFLALPCMAGLRPRVPATFDHEVRDAVLGCAYKSGSELVLLPFQDALGARERVNVPGTVNDDNWTYRMPMDLEELEARKDDVRRLAALAEESGRS